MTSHITLLRDFKQTGLTNGPFQANSISNIGAVTVAAPAPDTDLFFPIPMFNIQVHQSADPKPI